ncbi:MAG: hypothetical protein AAGF47_13060, partial [Planctomycetota bacterium]
MSGSVEADGLPEIAVAAELDGSIRLYRNEGQWDASPAASLTPIDNGGMEIPGFDIDVFGPLGIQRGTFLASIRDIEFVQMNPIEDGTNPLPDLVVAVEHPVPNPSNPSQDIQAGKVAVFVAERFGTDDIGYVFRSEVDFDLPVTGIALADAEGDGLLDVLAAVTQRDVLATTLPGADPSSTRVLRNSAVPQEGTLDATAFPVVALPDTSGSALSSGSVAVGDLYSVNIGLPGFPGGGGGFFETPEYVTLGGDPLAGIAPLRYGSGFGGGQFIHEDVASAATGMQTGLGGSTGLTDVPSPIEVFDPFANRYQSIVALGRGSDIALVHNDPLAGTFFNLTHATELPDEYSLEPCFDDPNLQQQQRPFIWRTLTTGNLNGGPVDVVYLNTASDDLTFLLGRGKPGEGNRVMEFTCNEPQHFIFGYGGSRGVGADRVITVDLDNDGDDEILVTRNAVSSAGPVA